MIRRPPRATRTYTHFPNTTRSRSQVLARVARHIPNLPDITVARQVLSPLDLERMFGLTEGDIFHGRHGLDQIFSLRPHPEAAQRSEEHTSELQSLMRLSYAVSCLKKKNNY